MNSKYFQLEQEVEFLGKAAQLGDSEATLPVPLRHSAQ